MFDFLKNIFGKPGEDQANGHAHSSPVARPPAAISGRPPVARPRPLPQAPRAPVARPNGNGNGAAASGAVLQLPLQSVLSGLPLELKGRIRRNEVGDATIPVSLETILGQLATGTVKVVFGELRRLAPEVFSAEGDHDQVAIPLPLNEILARLNPELFVRRKDQKEVEVPQDLLGPFSDRGQGLSIATPASKTEAPPAPRSVTPAPAPAPAPAQHAEPPPAPKPVAFPSRVVQPGPAPVPNRAPAHAGTTIPFRPMAKPMSAPNPLAPSEVSQTPQPVSFAPPHPPTAQPAPAAAPVPFSAPALSPAPAPAAAPVPALAEATLTVVLGLLTESWPDSLRQEITQLNLAEAKLAMPVETVRESLKRGRVAFTWKVIRSWIRPAPLPAVSVHDTLTLELPLKVVAPLFIQHEKAVAKPQDKVRIDESIPNLFFGFPQPNPSSFETDHAVTKPVDTNYYVWDDSSDSVKMDEAELARRPSPGTTFINRYATPNEVVSRASVLDGVSGALIALPDGLMVASQLSPDLNGETLAAFLPHIFGKVSQCTKELRMGELNNLNFTVGNVPWKIFRVNAIFFAAFGKPGQALPTAQLAALAAELDRKKQ